MNEETQDKQLARRLLTSLERDRLFLRSMASIIRHNPSDAPVDLIDELIDLMNSEINSARIQLNGSRNEG